MLPEQLTAQDTWDALLCEVDEGGTRRWLDADGNCHRETGPALIDPDGSMYWAKHGKYHREDGPAYISGSIQLYYLNGVHLSQKEFDEKSRKTHNTYIANQTAKQERTV